VLTATTNNSLAGRRNPDGPADQALAKIVELLVPGGYGFTVPAWEGDAYLKIMNAPEAITDLTVTSEGNFTWGYRFTLCPHLEPSRLLGVAIEILDPDYPRVPGLSWRDGFPLVEILRYELSQYGFSASISEAGPVLTVTNPKRPYRGSVEIADGGELSWHARAPHHRDGGIPLLDIAATISRALTRARHAPSQAAR
jgi:hypothetical protein